MEKEQIKIRDLRKKEKYFIDDAYLNGYAKLCGVYATAIYNSLSRHSNFQTQECFPSIDSMAKQHSMDKKTAIKAIKTLEKWHIVFVLKRKNKKTKRQLPNTYILLDKSEWIHKPQSRVEEEDLDIESRVDVVPDPSGFQGKSRVDDVHCKDDIVLRTTNSNVIDEPEVRSNGQELLNLFYKEINPNIKFNNKTTRADAEWLMDKYGIEKIESMVLYIKQHQGEQYFPSISTPTQLRDKMAQLINYLNKNKGENNNKDNMPKGIRL
ncbi:MAG: helix-turn-helix domain-containing protein [Bacilli bacterium]|nr:helix-turn-helix domain-containing protein [Bacilli bacterium]